MTRPHQLEPRDQEKILRFVTRWMDQNQVTQTELADRAGITLQHLNNVLNGVRPVTFERFVRILAVIRPKVDPIAAILEAVEADGCAAKPKSKRKAK